MTSKRSVLVIGARNVGKTSLITAALNGDFSEAYAPTGFKAEYFRDVYRKLELIDTPGVDLKILAEDSYRAFSQDPIVQEITGVQDAAHVELLKGFVKSTLYAIIIVHSNSLASERMANALHEVIRCANDDLVRAVKIYYVKNEGDILPTADERKFSHEWANQSENRILRPLKGNDATGTNHFTVNSQTFEGLDDLLNAVAGGEEEQQRRINQARAMSKRNCEPQTCILS